MEALLASFSTVALAEIGDRTQLLLLMLSVRFRRPWPVIAGMLVATVASNALAAAVGERVGRLLSAHRVDLLVGISLIAMALWELKPESAEANSGRASKAGAFRTTAIALFLAELGDKSQIATAVLAAAYANFSAVVAGATAGIVVTCTPVVLVGKVLANRLPLKAIRYTASILFLGLGILFVVRGLR